GVLLLSETAGAYEQLGALALPLAPADIEGTVRALHDALELPAEERRTRAAGLRRLIAEDDILHWLIRQFSDLHALA
ncbi:MAG TPA: trehalose-6-phosphate synthase, partial [Dehalococcoidia bacterium]